MELTEVKAAIRIVRINFLDFIWISILITLFN
jgi:hypothetical protein